MSIDGVTVNFAGLTALAGVSLDVRPGSVLGIIGPNGSGKTTLLNAASGLVSISSGRIAVDGHDITSASPARRARAGLARTFQHIRLFAGMSARDNVYVGADGSSGPGLRKWIATHGFEQVSEREKGRRVDHAMALLGIEEYGRAIAVDLPYGIQRRVEIARAIVGAPKALLLDEPTAGMNAAEADAIGQVVTTLRAADVAIVLIEHNVDLLMGVADQVAVLNFGTRIAWGEPEAVRRHPGVVEAYLGTHA